MENQIPNLSIQILSVANRSYTMNQSKREMKEMMRPVSITLDSLLTQTLKLKKAGGHVVNKRIKRQEAVLRTNTNLQNGRMRRPRNISLTNP